MTWESVPKSILIDFLKLLQPLAPHIAEELHLKLKGARTGLSAATQPLAYTPWPQFDPALLIETTLELPVQVNGKLKDLIQVPADAPAPEIEKLALASEKVQAALAGKTIKKIIVVPKKIVNIAVA
jgi:leucyl-tRNA synthetase